MDNAKIFDTLERKIEKLLGRLKSLEHDNDKLKADLAVSRKSEKEGAEARGELDRLHKDQETVRERLEKLIASLEQAEGKS
jgi:uncharacterized membrane protein